MNVRLLALAGVVAGAVALPLAVASAGSVDGSARSGSDDAREAVRGAARGGTAPRGDAKDLAATGQSPRLLGLGLATAARCGPELSSPDGVEAQTCVMTQGDETWARTYYRNATGEALDSSLSLMGPGGRTVQTRCAADADDEPATCETPRRHARGVPGDYTAVAEFAARGEDGPLLLRSGSNSIGSSGG
ncbi:hypothetical protein [Streptomyces sp. NPDC086787]|uniref:hypothetical protein n=1 Tax=Streptomyces sp. NPDC086787 TaxID=3365759 RepID=UPI00381E6BA0